MFVIDRLSLNWSVVDCFVCVQWEDFTLAELSSFLRVLDREEAHHELEIRKKYQRMNQCLVESLRKLDCSAACQDDDDTL